MYRFMTNQSKEMEGFDKVFGTNSHTDKFVKDFGVYWPTPSRIKSFITANFIPRSEAEQWKEKAWKYDQLCK